MLSITGISTRQTALSLYRALLRESKQVNDYNFRSYAIRRVKAEFRKSQFMESSSEQQQGILKIALQEGQEQLDVLRRQRILGSLYPSPMSVLEAQSGGASGIVSIK